jgi:hypothetical protein
MSEAGDSIQAASQPVSKVKNKAEYFKAFDDVELKNSNRLLRYLRQYNVYMLRVI